MKPISNSIARKKEGTELERIAFLLSSSASNMGLQFETSATVMGRQASRAESFHLSMQSWLFKRDIYIGRSTT
jgi:hypothetical protein